ncbi:MAG: ComF family protein [Anaerolineae bacterium]|nr:ComF family protein [Anaerolineae bacterium]
MTDGSGLPPTSVEGSLRSIQIRLFTHQLAAAALDFIFPPRCIQCHRVGSLLCPRCQAKIPVPPPIREAGSPLSERRATAEFDGAIQQAIHALKYKGQWRYAKPLSERLQVELTRSGWMPTLITAAPLHEARLRERGYNQSALLAEPVAQSFRLPFRPDAIQRIRDTRPQVGLGRQERQINVADAFHAEPTLVKNQQIVIVDDVYTTGATLRSCASALLEAGAMQVWAITVASAKHPDPI